MSATILPPKPTWLGRHPEVQEKAGKHRKTGHVAWWKPCHCGVLTPIPELGAPPMRGDQVCCSAGCYERGPLTVQEPEVNRTPWLLLCLLVLLLASVQEMGKWLERGLQ